DRRIHPSHGYRAVHVIIKNSEKTIEVQIRTELQHDWSELSEKLSDKIDPFIKYGGGDKEIQKWLCDISAKIKSYEKAKDSTHAEHKKEILNLKEGITDFIRKHSKLFL